MTIPSVTATPQNKAAASFPELDAALGLRDRIRSFSERIEGEREVPSELVEVLRAAQIFSLAIPEQYGGTERSPGELLTLIEELARTDSAVGWLTMIYNTTAFTASMLPPEWAAKIYGASESASITCGATAPTGKGRRVPGGLEVSGRWAWGSGSRHGDWICGGTLIATEDGIEKHPTGDPVVYVPYFEPDQVTFHDNWNPSGLRGTGSVDFEVDGAFVPEGRWIVLGSADRHVHTPFFRMPFFGLFAAAVAAVPIGIAQRALEEFTDLARKKVAMWQKSTLNESSLVQLELGTAEALIQGGRRSLHHIIGEVWEKVLAGEDVTIEDRRQIRLAASQATAHCSRAVDMLYEAGGGTSIQSHCGLQQCFRDIHAATQHRLVGKQPLQLAGALRLNGDAPGIVAL
ncbi:MAG: acyl-CoA dehydrogenase family protein [Acidobacteriota bacterium]